MAKSGRPGGGGTVTPSQGKTVNKIARQTRNLKNEQYRIINESGEVVSVGKGDKHSVGATYGEKREKMPGAVSIHNHPQGGTFSDADFKDFGFGARAVYAAAPEGTYSLVNKKFGTKNAKSGWYDMQEAYKKAAESTPRYKKLSAQANKISEQWVKAKNAGKPKSVLDGLYSKYNAVSEKASKVFKEEIRKAEVAPAHNWLKKNASKYGFGYSFKPSGR